MDIRDSIFVGINGKRFRADLTTECGGVLSGVEDARAVAERLGVLLELFREEGDLITAGDRIGSILCRPKEMAMAEEQIIGTMAKATGIATAARRAVELAGGNVRIVSGSWKKMPPPLKDMVRRAVATGGASFRICDTPMIYLDKNFISMLGSISAALEATAQLSGRTRVIQIKGRDAAVEEETRQAVEGGCDILMVDTGALPDLERCLRQLERMGCRERIQVAYAGGVRIDDIPALAQKGMDLLCIGKEIVDARLLDMKLDVTGEAPA